MCGPKAAGPPENLEDRFFEETCARDGKRNFVLSPKDRIEIDLRKLEMLLNNKRLRIRSSGHLGTTFDISDDIAACILKSGIMNVQAPPELNRGIRDEIFKFYSSILVDGFGFSFGLLPNMLQ